ncbi:MAG: carboxypeptidase regulatory-like domain-containing protein [Actinomycetota bacterium]
MICFCVILLLTSQQLIFAAGRADAGTIKGTVHAVAGGQSTVIAGAKLTLINQATLNQPIKTVSNASGDFLFDNLPSGNYILTIEADGLAVVTKEIKLVSGASLTLEINLTATVNESVTIRDEEGLLSTSETATSNVVRSETLKSQPLRTETYQSAIALTPGVIRDGYGNDFLKGTRTGQSSYTVNGADVTDPGTGKLAFEIPLEAAGSVQIEENPYSAEFGRFTGGVTNLQTKGGGDKFKISAARFFPTFHNIFSTTVDSFRPRITLSGALVPKRLYFLQSFEYRYSTFFTPSLPKTDNKSVQEGFNSFTQIDWNINKSNSLKFNAAIFPNKIRNLGLDTFNPAASTPNYKQRGMLFSVSEQSVFKDASFLASEFSYKTFDVDVFAKSDQPFNVAPVTNSGSYFADTRRRTKRIGWQETYYSRPLKFYGTHSLKAGFEFDRTSIGGQLRDNSIFIRRLDNTLAQRIDFTNAVPLNYKYSEAAFFVQDRLVVNPNLTLDYGLRFDRDGVTNRNNLAPRFSFLLLPLKNDRTIIRGGIGIFYDRSLSSAGYFNGKTPDDMINPTAAFDRIPERIVTDYAANGTTVLGAPRLFDTRLGSPLRTPRSVRWSLQLDRRITKDLTARLGFLQRFTKNDLLVDPFNLSATTGTLLLNSRGHSRYDELQFLLVYSNERFGQWNASYVFSRAAGDLNTADKFLGDTPPFVVRPNEYRRQPFDAPHRILFYGEIDVSKKHEIRVAPLFEIHSGFPYSAVNERLDFVGARNSAGRFPLYVSLDLQITKGIKLPFFKDKHARVGVALFNLTNHFNPRDVQMNLTSPNYGQFYNSLGTSVKAKFDVDF